MYNIKYSWSQIFQKEKKLEDIFKFQAPEWLCEASSIRRTQSSAVTCEPQFYLALSARCM
jgi:hypothetical protein